MSIVKEYLSNIELCELTSYKNMTTVAMKGLNFPEIKYSTLNEGIKNDSVKITEIDESGSVPTLNIINNGNLPVLLFDGEELKGAKQNRVLNTTILIPEHSEHEIPVSCTEQGRWGYTTNHFEDSGIIASSKIRGRKSESVSASLNNHDSYNSDQSEVWDGVEELQCCISNPSPTSAMKDVFEAEKDNLNDYIKKFPVLSQNGILIFINGELKGMEFLSTEENYEKYHEKIIKSYCLDALIDIEENIPNIDFIKRSKEFIKEIATIDTFEKPSVGYGYDYRFVNDNIAGAMLIHKNDIIHGAFFQKIKENEEFDDDVISSSQRAKNYDNY
ncbi:MAG: hypothetical protein FWH54_05255 [Methanobrevibacter sp.]|nr:hypothetical protein [Methanobrevibacter sp.]MCL2157409.1 hypothetical protein [Methanobrevibacter sp.]